jgi:hypothetical protein|tara:strand:+ start:548 stop:1138 length:591 start_codon:yes stop_codon:yes gene_type:complete
MASDVDICNSALNMIGASNIVSLTEDSRAARICNQRFEFVRDAVSRAHPWNCLLRRTSIAAESEAPAFEFEHQHLMPNDPFCLRVIRAEDLDTIFRVEGRKILSNTTPFNFIFVARVTDPNEYDQLLLEAMAARLAADISYGLVNSPQLTQTLFQLYETKVSEARFVDASEGTPDNVTNQDRSLFIESDVFTSARL